MTLAAAEEYSCKDSKSIEILSYSKAGNNSAAAAEVKRDRKPEYGVAKL